MLNVRGLQGKKTSIKTADDSNNAVFNSKQLKSKAIVDLIIQNKIDLAVLTETSQFFLELLPKYP